MSKRSKREVETGEYLDAAKRFILGAGRRVGEGDEPELRKLIALEGVLAEALQLAVDGQRANGKSWADIAAGTDATRSAAYQRWGMKR